MLFYDFEFNLLLIEPRIISWRFKKFYNEIGTFEAHLPVTSGATSLVLENDFLVCSIGGEYAIITGKQVENELVIYGRTCNWLLSKRVVLPFSDQTKLTGKFVKMLYEDIYTACPSIIFGTLVDGTEHTFSTITPRYLSETIFDALKADGLGNELVFDKDRKKWILNLIKGEDKSIMISEANKNAASTQVTMNLDQYANFCHYKSDRSYLTVGEETGIYKFETYLPSGSEQEAIARLANLKKENTIEVVATGPKYKKDYDLGDIVKVQIIKNDYKVTKRMRIRGVELISNPGGYTEKPIFEEV